MVKGRIARKGFALQPVPKVAGRSGAGTHRQIGKMASAFERPRTAGCTLVVAALVSLGGCSASLNDLPGDAGIAAAPTAGSAPAAGQLAQAARPRGAVGAGAAIAGNAPAAPAHAASASSGDLVTRFRTGSVVLYLSETGHEGQRVATSSLPLPIKSSRRSADGSRVEVMTVEGLRWIAAADLVDPTTQSSRAATPPHGSPTTQR